MIENEMTVSVPLEVVKASEIEPKEVKWLWYPYIPVGKVTLLQGDPGDGKSKLMLSIAALLSKGEPLPFTETEENEPMTIIYQTTEDDADDTVVPRFNSAGGNGENLIFIKEDEKSLSFGDNRIREAIEMYHAKLLILDPMSSYIGESCSMNNANETRAEFNHLIAVAKDTGCAIVIIAHMNKMRDTNPLYRTNGSIDIAGAARSILAITRTPNKEVPAERYLVQVKSNLAPTGSAILFEVSEKGVDFISEMEMTAEEAFQSLAPKIGRPNDKEVKQKFISQIMTSKSPVRSAEDVDEVALSFAEVKMLATGDARFKEKMDLDIQVSKLRVLKQSYLSEHYDLEDRVLKYYPQTIKEYEERIAGYEYDAVLAEQHKPQGEDKFCPMTLKGVTYTEKADAGEMLLAICKDYPMSAPTEIGSYRGFRMEIYYDTVNAHYCMNLCGKAKHKVDLGADAIGNLTRIENELSKLPARLEAAKTKKAETIAQLETAKEEIKKPFAFEDELKEKTERLNALNIELNLNEKDTSVMDTEPEQTEEQPERKCASRER